MGDTQRGSQSYIEKREEEDRGDQEEKREEEDRGDQEEKIRSQKERDKSGQ